MPQEFKVTQKAIIKKVTPQHLDSTYTCIATNIVGNSSVTIKLRTKVKGTVSTVTFKLYFIITIQSEKFVKILGLNSKTFGIILCGQHLKKLSNDDD